MNDPLGLFGEEKSNDPLGLFEDTPKKKERSGAQMALGALETGLGMVAGLPSQIAGGLAGFGSLMIGEGPEKAAQRLAAVQEHNFGFGAYSPSTEAGQEYTEGVTNALNYPVEKAGDIGGWVGKKLGNEAMGRYYGELPMAVAMEMIEPTAIYAGARGLARRGAKPGTPRPELPEPAAKVEVPQTPNITPEQLNLFDEFEQRSPISPYQTEMAPDMWRVDENGIPIRADLSMEAQNLQNPLQRNLWGDEVDVNFPRDPNRPLGPLEQGDIPGVERFSDPTNFKNDPENQIGITQAIDNMPEGIRNREGGKFAPGTTRQSALDLLRGEIEASPALEVAKMEQEGFKFPKSQRGVIDPSVFLGEFPDFVATKIKDAAGQLKALYRGIREDYTKAERPMLGTLGEGIYLTESNTLANNYARGGLQGRQVRAYFANVKNPFEIEMGGPEHQNLLLGDRASRKAFSDAAKAAGHDAIIVRAADGQMKEVMVFSPDQIKNAFSTPKTSAKVKADLRERIIDRRLSDPNTTPEQKTALLDIKRSFNFKKQGGGLYLGNKDALENSLARNLDGTFIPNNPDVSKAIEAAKKDGKDSKIWTYTQSGSTSAAMKTGSPIIKAASEVVQNAMKRADRAIRSFVFPAEKALRDLSKKELVDLGKVLKEEMLAGQRFSSEQLMQSMSVKQLKAYTAARDLFDKTLDAQNAARVAMGKEPITAHEAYLSSRWQGDFRQPVYDANGKLVWYLAANSRVGLTQQAKALSKIRPDLVIDPKKAHTVRSTKSGTDLQSAYSTMLDILGRNDPAIQKLKNAIEDQMSVEAESALAQTKHFEKKTGVRGFAGDRPWIDSTKDTLDMFKQQMQFAKNAFKWSELQKVGNDIKAIVSDPELQETQPNNIKYIREYYKNAVGMGEAEVTRAVNDAIREGFGISPNVLNDAVGNVKSFFIMQKLAVSAGYTLSNLVQTTNVLPYLSDLANQGIVGNPAKALPVGLLGGTAMGLSHYVKALGSEYLDSLPNQFFKDAFKYAEENGVTARSVYDEASVEDSFSTMAKAANVAGKTMTIPETFVRSWAFMTYAQWLKDSGKFPDQSKLFQKAEELVNMSMVDYRETERPMMFAKAGAAGNLLNTLQTYPMSFYNQWAYMLGQAVKGKPAGLLAIFALQYALAGAMGIPGFDDTDKLYKWIRDNTLPTGVWKSAMESPFFSDPKLWMLENLGQGAVYGALSDQTGLGMTSRVAAPGGGAMLQSPLGPVADIAGQVGAVASAVADPTNTTKLGQAAMRVTPVGLQGLLEQAPFMENITYVTNPDGSKTFMKSSDLAKREAVYTRTPEEQAVRNWGIRSQKEVLTKDVDWAIRSQEMAGTQKAGELVDKIYDASRRGDVKKVKELSTLYTQLTGKAFSDTQMQNQVEKEFLSTFDRRTKDLTNEQVPQKLLNYVRMKKILEKDAE